MRALERFWSSVVHAVGFVGCVGMLSGCADPVAETREQLLHTIGSEDGLEGLHGTTYFVCNDVPKDKSSSHRSLLMTQSQLLHANVHRSGYIDECAKPFGHVDDDGHLQVASRSGPHKMVVCIGVDGSKSYHP